MARRNRDTAQIDQITLDVLWSRLIAAVNEQSAALIRYLDNLGYAMYWHLPLLFNPKNFAGNSQNVFGNIVSKNMICMPKTQPHQMNGFEQVAVPAESST